MTQRIRGMGALALALGLALTAYSQDDPVINVGDLIHIDVYRAPQLSSSMQVDPSGNVTFPFDVGAVNVSGKTTSQAAAAISQSLKSILRNPRVTVSKGALARTTPIVTGRTPNMTLEMIPLKNSSAERLSDVLQGMTSPGGRISHDPDTNTLFVTDTPDTIQNMMSIVTRLDDMQSQLTQVRIEAKFAEVRVGAMKELGVRWFVQGDDVNLGFTPTPRQDPNLVNLRGPLNAGANEQVGSQGQFGGSPFQFVDPAFDRRLQVPVQVGVPGQTFFGFSNAHVDIGAMLDALVSDNEASLLAHPMTVTVNHQPSVIKMVDEFPYTEFGTEITGASSFSTAFLDMGITLEVTPHVYQDETGPYVKMDLMAEVSFPVGSANGVPIRSVRRSESRPSVRDGQTLVIGGILREDERTFDTGIPGLRKLPLVGGLFKHKEESNVRTELMIFVTPTVHDRPEEITWDKMIDVTENLQDSALIPTAEIRRESRKD